MKRIRIEHHTAYEYSQPVTLLPHRLLLRPRSGHDIRIEHANLAITPSNRVIWHRDIYGNSVAVVTFDEPSQVLSIDSEVNVIHYEDEPLSFRIDERAVVFPFYSDLSERVEMIPYQLLSFPNDNAAIREWLHPFWRPGQVIETFVLLNSLNRDIAEGFDYGMREEPGVQRPSETLQKRAGSCRDFAALFIEGCRYFGFAARFVSGYLYSPHAQRGLGSTHAWSEVYLPGAGWVGFDSTSGLVAGPDHIAVAVTRHPAEAPPVSGSFLAPPLAQPPVMRVKVNVKAL